jgi:hypothetical protein
MIRNRQAVAPVGLQPVLFNVQQQNRPAACAPPPAGTGNNRTSGSTVVLLSCLIIIIITIVICAMVFIFFGANFEEDVSCSLRLHKFFKVNSVQEACTKCFAIYILRFEILQTTWRNKKRHQNTKGAFTYEVRWFLGIFDLPTYPNQILYFINLFSKIICSFT